MTTFPTNERLLKVPLYIGGKSIEEVRRELGVDEIIKLASNECPLGPSPMAVEAAREALSDANRYPGTADLDLRRKLAPRLDAALDESNVVLGNGGTDVLRMIAQAFVFERGVNTIMCRASFPMWHIATMMAGGDCIFIKPTADYGHDLPAMAARINANTRVVYVCSPNNPTGNIVTQAHANDFMARVPERVVVVWDEAYCAYVDAPDYADSLRYVKDGRNVLVVRSFSKSAGLANMRIGYAIGHTELADYLRHAQNPFHTGAASLAGAAASLDDAEYLASNRQMVLDGRAFLRAEFEKLGLNSLPSQANFVAIVDPPMPPEDLADTLLHRGFIVRAMEPFGLPNAVRVTVGTQAENEKFVAVLGDVISEA